MAKKRKRRSRKRKLSLNIQKKTIFSLLWLVFWAVASLIIFSFSGRGTLLSQVAELLFEAFGKFAFLLPFLLVVLGAHFSRWQTPLKEINVLLGGLLFFVSGLGVAKAGKVGAWLWGQLQFLLGKPAAGFLYFLGCLMGVVVLFNTSLEEIVDLFLAGIRWGRQFIFQARQKAKRAVFVGEKSIAQPQQPILETKPPAVSPPSSLMPRGRQTPGEWQKPPLSLLEEITSEADRGDIRANADTIEKTLESFGITARVVEINKGPAVTQYALKVALGTKLSRITALSNDLALALAAPTGQIRIEAPIPGRSLVGIEVPNRAPQIVSLKMMLTSPPMEKAASKLTVPLGLDVSGNPRVVDIARMPHVLIAGQTGSGKSVLLNSWVATFLFRTNPNELRLILVDPKRVELTRFGGVPHLLTPVIYEPEKVLSALSWAIAEMRRRYQLFSATGARNIEIYNQTTEEKLPYVVIIIDELADIMLFAPSEVEEAICRIAQMARATGIHLILATQRPSVDILTGLIKANIPARISFAVASMTDSRVILDQPGAEKLLGRGDMLFLPPDRAKPIRIQGPFITDVEVKNLVAFFTKQGEPQYNQEVLAQPVKVGNHSTVMVNGQERDSLFDEAVEVVKSAGRASASLLQRRLKIGYARAARLLDQLEAAGIVGPAEGSKPREVLVK